MNNQKLNQWTEKLRTAFKLPVYTTGTVITFGRKYKGLTLGEVLDLDSKWVAWAVLDAEMFDVLPDVRRCLIVIKAHAEMEHDEMLDYAHEREFYDRDGGGYYGD